MGNAGDIQHSDAARRLASGLNLFIGRGRNLTAPAVAVAAGWSESALEKARSGEYTPGLGALLRMQAVLPAAFTNHLIEPAGLGGARRLDGEAKAAGAVMAELADQTAMFARALADGRIDHIEAAALRRTLPALIEDLTNLMATLGKGV